jgi:hypothetical protein
MAGSTAGGENLNLMNAQFPAAPMNNPYVNRRGLGQRNVLANSTVTFFVQRQIDLNLSEKGIKDELRRRTPRFNVVTEFNQ